MGESTLARVRLGAQLQDYRLCRPPPSPPEEEAIGVSVSPPPPIAAELGLGCQEVVLATGGGEEMR